MVEKNFAGLPLWNFENLSTFRNIKHFVSGRAGGVSIDEKGSLNLGIHVGDLPEHVYINRTRIAVALGISPVNLVIPEQTHGNRVVVVNSVIDLPDLKSTDALITNVPGICLAVLAADCVPVLLYDPIKHAIGAVHAGWRGTTSKILSAAVVAMKDQYGTNPSDLVASIGPSICPEVYEVGAEVIAAVNQAFGNDTGLLTPTQDHKALFNLWEANSKQLTGFGVVGSNIEIAGICTYSNSDVFFSARKSHNRAGRFGAGIMLVK